MVVGFDVPPPIVDVDRRSWVSHFTRAVRRNIPKLTRSFAIHELPVPSLGDSISDGTLVEFLKTPGMGVETDEIVAVIETDQRVLLMRVVLVLELLLVVLAIKRILPLVLLPMLPVALIVH